MIVRIGTYNVRNLASLRSSRQRQIVKHQKLLVAVGRMIRGADAHVLALQEVGDLAVLARLDDQMMGGRYHHRHLALGNAERRLGLAVLSEAPLITLQSHRQVALRDRQGDQLRDREGRAIGFRRDFLQVEIGPFGEEPLTLFVAHLKSALPLDAERYDFDAETYRLAEATTGASIVRRYLEEQPTARVVVLGDFNDEDRCVASGSGSSVAPLIDGLGFFDPVRDEFPAQADRWTASWKAHGRRQYDFILLSPSLRSCYRSGSAKIHRQIPAGRASDHRPVTVELDLP